MSLPSIAKTILRIIGTLTVPFILLFLTVVIGNVVAQMPMPWRDASIGNPDCLSLLGSSFFGGVVFSMSAHKLSPRYKNIAVVLMILLATSFFTYGSFLVYDKIGGFGIVRYAVSIIGMIVGSIAALRLDK